MKPLLAIGVLVFLASCKGEPESGKAEDTPPAKNTEQNPSQIDWSKVATGSSDAGVATDECLLHRPCLGTAWLQKGK